MGKFLIPLPIGRITSYLGTYLNLGSPALEKKKEEESACSVTSENSDHSINGIWNLFPVVSRATLCLARTQMLSSYSRLAAQFLCSRTARASHIGRHMPALSHFRIGTPTRREKGCHCCPIRQALGVPRAGSSCPPPLPPFFPPRVRTGGACCAVLCSCACPLLLSCFLSRCCCCKRDSTNLGGAGCSGQLLSLDPTNFRIFDPSALSYRLVILRFARFL